MTYLRLPLRSKRVAHEVQKDQENAPSGVHPGAVGGARLLRQREHGHSEGYYQRLDVLMKGVHLRRVRIRIIIRIIIIIRILDKDNNTSE